MSVIFGDTFGGPYSNNLPFNRFGGSSGHQRIVIIVMPEPADITDHHCCCSHSDGYKAPADVGSNEFPANDYSPQDTPLYDPQTTGTGGGNDSSTFLFMLFALLQMLERLLQMLFGNGNSKGNDNPFDFLGDGEQYTPSPSSEYGDYPPDSTPPMPPDTPYQPPGSVPGSGVASPNPFSTAPQVGQLSEAEGKAQAVKVAEQLMKDFPGLTKEQAAGIAGNLWHESAGMNANVNEFGSDPSSPTYGPPNGTQFGYGWAQWTGSRKTDYLNFCKSSNLDPASPAANYAMLKHELQTSESGTIPAVKATSTAEEAAVAFRKVFERAASPIDQSRIAGAKQIYASLA